MTGQVKVQRTTDVVTLTLTNPGKRNAITYPMYDALEHECQVITADPTVRALVLRGADGAFAGGTDIRHLADIDTGQAGVDYEARMTQVQHALLDLRIPVIAIVDGPCVGGGLVLAALADLVGCTPRSQFGSPIARTVGNTMSATSLARLHACLGRRRTSQMLLTGRLLTADDALTAGFVNVSLEITALEEWLTGALSDIVSCAPLTIRSFKELERRLDASIAGVPTEDVFAGIYGSDDFRNGVDAFLTKRPARFEGH